jgi:protein-S-isoprenylcysteine O-methyltransferase Ste14
MKKILPPTYFFVAIVSMVVLHFLLPLGQLIVLPWRLLGVLPLVVGAHIDVRADRAFKEHRTTVKPFEVSSALVTDGVFSFSRHPMYLGMLLILVGIAILQGSLTPCLVVPVFAILIDLIFIRVEECMLKETFGQQYEEYRNRVRRWI